MELNPLVFRLSILILRAFSRIYFRATCHGHENYPVQGPYLIALNHNSLMDIPVMAMAVPGPMFTMAKESLFKIPILAWWMRSVGFFPVRRGASDQKAFQAAKEILRQGGILTMAPEGTRRRLDEGRPKAHTGIVRLAQELRCPIIPVGVIGTRRALPPGAKFPRPFKIRVVIGEPIHLEPIAFAPKNQAKLQAQANLIMDRIYQLSGESYPISKSTERRV
ncbi:MAG: lysophospholipid acyltransferase family protein [bacterium]